MQFLSCGFRRGRSLLGRACGRSCAHSGSPHRRPFSIPPGAGFTDLAPDLPGVATDGGYDTVDFALHEPRVDSPDGLTFDRGPSRRFIGEATPRGIRATEVIAGGESGEPTDGTFGNQLGPWLTNETRPALATPRAVAHNAASTERFTPTR